MCCNAHSSVTCAHVVTRQWKRAISSRVVLLIVFCHWPPDKRRSIDQHGSATRTLLLTLIVGHRQARGVGDEKKRGQLSSTALGGPFLVHNFGSPGKQADQYTSMQCPDMCEQYRRPIMQAICRYTQNFRSSRDNLQPEYIRYGRHPRV